MRLTGPQCYQLRFDAFANGGLEIARWYQVHLLSCEDVIGGSVAFD
jgi:hypothetical protein